MSLNDFDKELARRLVEQEGALLLDVRTAGEYAAGHIDGAVNIPHDEIVNNLVKISGLVGGDKSKPIVLYCRSGQRASFAKYALINNGYSMITNVGGISDY